MQIDIHNIFENHVNIPSLSNHYKECSLDIDSQYCNIDILYYKLKDNEKEYNIAKLDIDMYSKSEIFIKLLPEQNILLTKYFVDADLEYLLVKDEVKNRLIIINLDTLDIDYPDLWIGDNNETNYSYYYHSFCFNKKWRKMELFNDNLVVVAEKDNIKYLYFCKISIDMRNCYINVLNNDNIKLKNVYSISYNNLFIVTDHPEKKRVRKFIIDDYYDYLIEIHNSSYNDNDYVIGELSSISYKNTVSSLSTPNNNNGINIYNLDKIMITIKNKNSEILQFIVFDKEKNNNILMNFTDNMHYSGDSKYTIIKKSLDDSIYIYNNMDNEMNKFILEDEVFSKSTSKDICLSDNGKYLCIISLINNKIPYFNIYECNYDKNRLFRLSNKYSINCSFKDTLYWKENIITLEHNNISTKYEIKNNTVNLCT